MDLAAMMNDGGAVLHRGSVDHRERLPERKLERPRAPAEIPVWARIYNGAQNKVRDERFTALRETRAEFRAAAAALTPRESPPPAAAAALPAVPARLPPTRATEVGPGGNVSLTGLAPSIAALIPSDDVAKVLAGWVFEQLARVEDVKTYAHLEVEFRLGVIADEATRMRHRFPALSECVVDTAYWARSRLFFRSGADAGQFGRLVDLLDKVADANALNTTNTVQKTNALLRDDTYKCALTRFGLGPKSIRVTSDENGRFLECIFKQRLGDLYVAMPNSSFDLKMTLSVEHPVEEAEIKPLVKNLKPSFQRNKNRLSWVAPGCRADLTTVHGAQQPGAPTDNVTREVEVEASTKLLAEALTSYKLGSDPGDSLDRFLEVMRYTLDSARYIIRNA